jgi:CheY-like chemotaxis protein
MEVVGQLAGGVAHDFNNILAAMILKLEIWQMQHRLSAETRSSLCDLEELAKRAANLTRQLLLFSRQHAMHPEKLEVDAALGNLLKMVERLLGPAITCVQLPGTRELWVEADLGMLNQAVMNLCLNAKDAMPNGGTLTLEASLAEFNLESVRLHLESRPGQFVCLRISDTGCGMDEDVLEHLFEPFFTTKEVGQGPGLGLASAYGIVHQHKGWMNVQSVVGHGATFRLYLPLSEKKVAPPAPTGTGQMPAFKGKNETILLVEDEGALLLLSVRALTLLGYRVLAATNAQEALEIWEQHRNEIDLVLTDMRMPKGISGLELAEKLWKSKPSLKIIIMSGYNMEMAQGSAPSRANYTFLAKPFELKTLAETVRLCLD